MAERDGTGLGVSGAGDAANGYGVPRRFVSLFLAAAAMAMLVLAFISPTNKGSLAIAAVVSLALLVIWPLVSIYESIGIGPSGIVLKKVNEADRKASDAVGKIGQFIFMSMPEPMYRNLRKLADPAFGKFKMSDGFRQELRYLRDRGYLTTVMGGIGEIPPAGEDLSDYLVATQLGRDFISNRELIVQMRSKVYD